jgi:hypothetical protein
MMAQISGPILAAMAAATAALITVLLFGWRGGLAAAAAGALFLAGGLAGDLLVHEGQGMERAQLTARMTMMPDPMTAERLHELEDAEMRNRWHLVAVGGEALLVMGLAGACVGLWRWGRRNAADDLLVGAIERAAAWPMGNSTTPSLWNEPAPVQQPAMPAPYRPRGAGPTNYRRVAS